MSKSTKLKVRSGNGRLTQVKLTKCPTLLVRLPSHKKLQSRLDIWIKQTSRERVPLVVELTSEEMSQAVREFNRLTCTHKMRHRSFEIFLDGIPKALVVMREPITVVTEKLKDA